MKKLLLQMIVCGAALLPFSQIQAATYGGWAPGKKFTFTVKEKESASLTLGGKPKMVAVPAGVPNFKKGQKVVFKIGSKGQLTAPGMSLPFKSDAGSANVYYIEPSRSHPQADIGQVFKDSTGKPNSVALSFFRVKPGTFTTTTVVYTLE